MHSLSSVCLSGTIVMPIDPPTTREREPGQPTVWSEMLGNRAIAVSLLAIFFVDLVRHLTSTLCSTLCRPRGPHEQQHQRASSLSVLGVVQVYGVLEPTLSIHLFEFFEMETWDRGAPAYTTLREACSLLAHLSLCGRHRLHGDGPLRAAGCPDLQLAR